MAYLTQRDTARSADFQGRVLIAMCKTALDVYAESTGVTNHAIRATFATAVLNAPLAHLDAVCYAVVSDDTTLANASDAALASRVSAIWNALAAA